MQLLIMFKEQCQSRREGHLSPNTHTFRRLNRRIRHNMGLLNSSRSSNKSSFRMGRTELSGDRHSSRETNQGSQHISNLPPQQIVSEKSIPKNMTSLSTLNRPRLNYCSPKTNNNGAKNIVENLYMLNNGESKNTNRPQKLVKHQYKQTKREESPFCRERGGKRHENRQGSNSNSQSRLGQRQRIRQREGKQCSYNKKQNKEIRRLQQKYLENVYELNGKNEGKSRKRISERHIIIDKRLQQQMKVGSKHSIASNSSTNNINLYYFNSEHDNRIASTSPSTQTNPSFNTSQPSLPLHSVASQKDAPSIKTPTRHYQKTSIKLDRAKESKKEKVRQVEAESSSLSVRWKMNNIKLQERKDEQRATQEKVIEGTNECPAENLFLPIQSKQNQDREWAEDILQRIILHLDYLNLIANYTKEFRKIYDSTEQWEVLIFLAYKKFYIERTKVANILRTLPSNFDEESKLYAGQNPFILPYSKIDQAELQSFRGSRQCTALRYQLEAEDNQIRNALRGLYNLYIEKSGEHVNMFDCDNFSDQIYKLMLQQIEAISQNLHESSLMEVTKIRMGKIIQTGLLIAYLNGKYVKNFSQILLYEDMVKVGKRETLRQKCIVDLFLPEFKKVLS